MSADFTVALDGDRPTEISFTVIVSRAKNNRGKPRANVSFRCGKAKRRDKGGDDLKIPPAGRGPLSRRKST